MTARLPPTLEGWLPRLAFGLREHEARLIEAITALLTAGRNREALLLSQRLCAIAKPVGANAFVLRAAALAACGEPGPALADTRAALELDPDHEAALRLILMHGSDGERSEAQQWLARLAVPSDPEGSIARPAEIPPAAVRGDSPAPVLIIVPVYGDAAATERCLASLLVQRSIAVKSRIVVIDDASPDTQIRDHVDRLAKEGRITLLRNKTNLGFAGSVNQGLSLRRDEDVLLVNADTVVPPKLVDRLSAAAYRQVDTGTVTPLSNNGEYASLPLRFCVNSMLDAESHVAFDQRLASAFGPETVEMPNGIGFCLFIRRAMLDAIGGFSTAFGRGYGEDIEFCLRGAAAGFRNLAALGVFVGHEGGRSFGSLKRALVKRNLARLDGVYPSYRRASALFVNEDPIGRRLADALGELVAEEPVSVILGPMGFAGQWVQAPAAESTWPATTYLIEAGKSAGQVSLRISAASGAFPQQLTVLLPDDETEARTALQGAGLGRIISLTLVDPALLANATVRHFIALAERYDIVGLRDPGLFCPALSGTLLAFDQCRFCEGRCPCRDQKRHREQPRLRSLVHGARRLTMRHPALLALARQRFGSVDAELAGTKAKLTPSPPAFDPQGCLALVAERGGAEELAFAEALGAMLRKSAGQLLLVFGPLIDPAGLASQGNILPMGYPDDKTLSRLGTFGIGALVFADRRLGSTHPLLLSADASSIPSARFHWHGRTVEAPGLSLPLAESPAQLAERVGIWFAALCGETAPERAPRETAPRELSATLVAGGTG